MKVSVIIATYNRFKKLKKAIESVRRQTFKDIEIVIANDCSSDRRYYKNKYRSVENIIWVDLAKNSKEIFGTASPGHVRNKGIERSSGEFIAILDDDDIYFNKNKLQFQIDKMKELDFSFSSTEALMGQSFYRSWKRYPLYYQQYYLQFCKDFFKQNYGGDSGKLPSIFDFNLIVKHNFIIHSSVIYTRELFNLTDGYDIIKVKWNEDHALWLKFLKLTSCLYIDVALVYYDGSLHNEKQSLIQ